ncbi:MAG: hypothetical protein Q9215_003863 [Flavoplaca cf. flavocitrina]
MGTPGNDQSVGDLSASSLLSSESPTSAHDSFIEKAHDLSESLTEQESAFLDQSISLLDQEYDHQRQLLHHYSTSRHPATNPVYPPNLRSDPDDAEYTGQHIQANRLELDGSRRGNTRPPPRIYTGMEDGATVEKGGFASSHNAYAYQYSHHRRPLIDRIQNRWRSSASSELSPSSPLPPSFSQIISAPKFRRYLLTILLVFLIPWSCWRYILKSLWEDHQILDNALNKQLGKGAAYYGLNVRPAFRDMIQLQTWDTSLLSLGDQTKRLVFIGDVHGCYDELVNLLAEAKYNNETDQLIFTGDLIAKGPASAAVVDFAIQQHASCVRGNHEDRIMLAYRDRNSHVVAAPSPSPDESTSTLPNPGGPFVDSLDDESFSHGDYIDRELTKGLTTEQASYLASCPVILDIGRIPGIGHTIAVHAGLIPGVDLDNQDPMGIMSMKTVDLATHVPSRNPKGTPWFKLWNAYQSVQSQRDRSTVIYGHDAKQGLAMHRYTKGLDTGCVEGGKLTAWVVTIETSKKSSQKTLGVKCKDYRGLKGKGKGWEELPYWPIKEDEHGGKGSGRSDS